MKTLDVDFMVRPRPGRWLWRYVALQALLALGLVCWTVWLQRLVADAQSEAEQARAHASAMQTPRPETGPAPAPPYQASAETFLKAAQANWPEALRSLESAAMPSVVIKSLDYDGNAMAFRIEVTLEQPGLLPEYLLALHAGEDVASSRTLWSVQWVRRMEGTLWGASLMRPVTR